MSVTGFADGPPTKAGTSIGDITGGLFLLAERRASALYHRERTGAGLKVDVSLLDGQIAILRKLPWLRCGEHRPRSRPAGQPPPVHHAVRVVRRGGSAARHRRRQRRALRPAVLQGAGPASNWPPTHASPANRARTLHADGALKAEPEESVLALQSAAHWILVLEAAGVPCSPVQTVADAVEHPQVQARNMIVEAGGLRMAGNPVKLSAFADPETRSPAPALDADGEPHSQEFR